MTRIAIAVALFVAAASATAADHPNIVFILADDLGWTDLGCQGSKYYETPNIDRMAAEGVRFTNGYSCGPNCQPTRAALMSGQYAPRTGVYTVGNINRFDWKSRPVKPVENVTKLDPAIVTIGESMKAAGYATGYFGKWHLGDDPEHHPTAQGFDEAIVSAGKHFNFKTVPDTDYPEGTYLADFLTDKAVDFLDRHQDGPFYLELAHFGVHSPYQAKEDLIARFKEKPGAGGHNDPVYAAMIASVDESVGRVLKKLDELGIAGNTLVVFTSDNGGVGGYEREGLHRRNGDTTDNVPLRGGKGMLYEGGIRVPYIFRWKNDRQLPAGTVMHRPINSVDLYPTLLELTGASKPDQPLDGESYLASFTQQAGDSNRQAPLYWHFPGYLGQGMDQWRTLPVGAIRDGDWKLMEFFEDGHLELYNLKEDLGETRNLAKDQPERATSLQQQLAAWRKDVGAKLPAPHEPQESKTDANGRRGKKRKRQ